MYETKPEEAAQIQVKMDTLSQRMAALRGDIRMCKNILERSRGMAEKMESDFMPPMPEVKPSTMAPINLVLRFQNVQYAGALSATRAKHRVSHITAENNQELGMLVHTLCPAVNNGVIATFDGASAWTVTKTCYLTALHLEPGAMVQAPAGKALTMTVDGVETPIAPGHYFGNIVMTILE